MDDSDERGGSVWRDLRPTGGVVVFAAFCGLMTFLGVLLFAPSSGGVRRSSDDSPRFYTASMRDLISEGRFETLVEEGRGLIESGRADSGQLMFYAWSLEQLGRDAEAHAVWTKLKRMFDERFGPGVVPEDMWSLLTMGWGELRAGDPERARELFRAGAEMSLSGRRQRDGYAEYNAACGYALAGDRERALEMLEAAIRHGFVHSRENYAWIRADPDFVESGLTELPRFEELLGLARELRRRAREAQEAAARGEPSPFTGPPPVAPEGVELVPRGDDEPGAGAGPEDD